MPKGWQAYRVQEGDTLESIDQRVTIALNKELDEKQLAVVKLAIVDANCQSLPTEVSKGKRLYVPVAPVEPTAVPTSTKRSGILPASALSLELTGKTEDGEPFDLPGEAINYRYVAVNASSEPLEGPVTVRDNRAAVICPEIKLLNPNETVTCTRTYNVTQVDLDYGSVTNNAIAIVDKVESNEAILTLHAMQDPALTLSKAANPTTYDHVGQTITYTYTILNNGNVTLSPVQFTVKDEHIGAGNEFNCGSEATELAPNAIMTCTATYHITQADIDARSVTNNAAAVVYGLKRQLIPISPAALTINYALPITLNKTADLTNYDSPGQTIRFAYTIKNITSAPLPGPVNLTDDKTIPTCPEIRSLAPNETVTCTGSYSITQADLDDGSLTNTASARLGEHEPVKGSVTIHAIQNPALIISKTANPTTYAYVGQTITYTYIITNTGNVTLDPTTLSVSDDHITGGVQFHCGSEKTKFAPNETITCPAIYNITQADADASFVTNGAGASIVYKGAVISSPRVTSTITYTCPYPPAGWDLYIIQSGDSLSEISSWYGNTVLDLQRANCMGLLNNINEGSRLYVPYISSITGTVYADPDGDGERDTGEPVLSGFMVPISRIGGNFKQEVVTDGNGKYIIPNLPPGNYLVLYAPVNLTSRVTLEKNFGVRPVR